MKKAQGSLEYLLIFAAILALAVVVILVVNSVLGSPVDSSSIGSDKANFALAGIAIQGYDNPFNFDDPSTYPTSFVMDENEYIFSADAADGEVVGELTDSGGSKHKVYFGGGGSGGGGSKKYYVEPTGPTCSDGIPNQGESGVDCGGPCGACNDESCVDGGECASGVCLSGFCAAPTCSDGLPNQGESDVDCGGPNCGVCEDGKTCGVDDDCLTGWCNVDVCVTPTCFDNAQNQGESGVDCGGPCGACIGEVCVDNPDCASGVCLSGFCAAPTCSDGFLNQEESDVDCGGPNCDACADGKTCGVGTDCGSGVCSSGFCAAPTCSDGIPNQDETGIDCGGSCGACIGEVCVDNPDCGSGVCSSGFCAAPTCSDGFLNQGESDVDCGGPNCGVCEDGKTCGVDDDCSTGWCNSIVCVTPTCFDGVKNQGEVDIDCGGPCGACGGDDCTLDDECASNHCDLSINQCVAVNPPTCDTLSVSPNPVYPGELVSLSVSASDVDGDSLICTWDLGSEGSEVVPCDVVVTRNPYSDFTASVSVFDGVLSPVDCGLVDVVVDCAVAGLSIDSASVSPSSGPTPLGADWAAVSSGDDSNFIYSWSFVGDTGSALGKQVSYPVDVSTDGTIYACDLNTGCISNTKMATALVFAYPVVDAGQDVEVDKGEVVSLDGSCVDDDLIVSCDWYAGATWLGADPFSLDTSSMSVANHVFTLKGRNNHGLESTEDVVVTVVTPPQPPVADLVYSPLNPIAPVTVTLDASGTTDSDSSPADLMYKFKCTESGSGTGWQVSNTHDCTYSTSGFYTPSVDVRDDTMLVDGAVVPSLSIYVSDNQAPTCSLPSANPSLVSMGDSTELSVVASDVDGSVTCLWSLKDDVGGSLGSVSGCTVDTTQYENFNAEVTVTDDRSASVKCGPVSVSVSCTNVVSTTASASPDSGAGPLVVGWSATGDAGWNYAWSFPGPVIKSGKSVSHTVTEDTVGSVNVVDSNGCSDSDSVSVTITEYCGDGVIEGGEACDGSNLNGADCTTVPGGFNSGTLSCDSACSFDISSCELVTVCGDGNIEGTEQCDDGANGNNCDGCTDTCTTFTNVCGDDELCGIEQCDDGNLNDNDGCQSDCTLLSAPFHEVAMSRNDATVETDHGLNVQFEGKARLNINVKMAYGTCSQNYELDYLNLYVYYMDGSYDILKIDECESGSPSVGTNCLAYHLPELSTAALYNFNYDIDVNPTKPIDYVKYFLYSPRSCGALTELRPSVVTFLPAVCGNRDLEQAEECDDGNRDEGDGCDKNCQLETNECPSVSSLLLQPRMMTKDYAQAETERGLNCKFKGRIRQNIDLTLWNSGGYTCQNVDSDNLQLFVNYTDGTSSTMKFDYCNGAPGIGPSCTAYYLPSFCGANPGYDLYYNVDIDPTKNIDYIGYKLYSYHSHNVQHVFRNSAVQLISSSCGNLDLEPGENCDDGNIENGDGCSNTCQRETEECVFPLNWIPRYASYDDLQSETLRGLNCKVSTGTVNNHVKMLFSGIGGQDTSSDYLNLHVYYMDGTSHSVTINELPSLSSTSPLDDTWTLSGINPNKPIDYFRYVFYGSHYTSGQTSWNGGEVLEWSSGGA